MQVVTALTRTSGRLPGSLSETACAPSPRSTSVCSLLPLPCSLNSLHFEGVTSSFHKTSPFYFLRFSAPRAAVFSLPRSLPQKQKGRPQAARCK